MQHTKLRLNAIHYGLMQMVELEPADLLPGSWRLAAGSGDVRVFNPSLLSAGSGYVFAYRAVLADGLRRIGLCRLDAQLAVLPGSAVPWSDHIRGAASDWFADPRLYRLDGRPYLYWNSGWPSGENHQFLQALDDTSLMPIGPPHLLTLAGPRQRIEKNWLLFGDPPGQAVYFPRPLRLLRFSWPPAAEFILEPATCLGWDDASFETRYGPLRGGAPPVPDGDGYWCVAHTVAYAPEGYRYRAALFRFGPDGVTHRPRLPLALPNPYRGRRRLPRLDPYVGEDLYPGGLVRTASAFLIAYGINEEHCAIATASPSEFLSSVEPV